VEVGPGLFPGEEHKIDLEVTAGHRVSITQQSATKVMPAHDSNFAVMELKLTANQGSSLVFLSEPTIMLPSAALSSGTTIHVDDEARLLFTEIIGEPPGLKDRPGYPRVLSTQLRIFCDGSLQFCDSVIIEETPAFSARECWQRVFGGSRASGSCYLVAYPYSLVTSAIKTVGDMRSGDETVCVSSAEPATCVSVVRALAPSAEMIKQYFHHLANVLNTNIQHSRE
jgi:urease accessory protein UreH